MREVKHSKSTCHVCTEDLEETERKHLQRGLNGDVSAWVYTVFVWPVFHCESFLVSVCVRCQRIQIIEMREMLENTHC
jgi:hypothetical protein